MYASIDDVEVTNWTIVEPGFQFVDPALDHMLFLECCARICHQSEGAIEPGSAERVLTTVVKKRKHLSVVEHATCILDIPCERPKDLLLAILELADPVHCQAIGLFAMRADTYIPGVLRLSGNVRMWMELRRVWPTSWGVEVAHALHRVWPFFFEMPQRLSVAHLRVEVLDSNPLTNRDKLSVSAMLKHMSLTCKIIGDRTMSHQLVRHRFAAYGQESQRYCDYGKKGFKFIVPPALTGTLRDEFILKALSDYRHYLYYRDRGLKPEDARGVLPGVTATQVMATYTLGMWAHVFNERWHNKKAQDQIRGIMTGIGTLFHQLLGPIFP